MRAALAADIVVVAAVGNQSRPRRPDARTRPSYDGVVGVGAISPDGLRLPTSQVGSYVDIVAPGDDVVVAAARRRAPPFQGTSLAVPFVAATAALIRARCPGLSQADVVRRLLATADPAPGGTAVTGVRLRGAQPGSRAHRGRRLSRRRRAGNSRRARPLRRCRRGPGPVGPSCR